MNLLAIWTISNQSPKPRKAEKIPMPIRRFCGMFRAPVASSSEKRPISPHPTRKATTIGNKHPVTGTVHP